MEISEYFPGYTYSKTHTFLIEITASAKQYILIFEKWFWKISQQFYLVYVICEASGIICIQ